MVMNPLWQFIGALLLLFVFFMVVYCIHKSGYEEEDINPAVDTYHDFKFDHGKEDSNANTTDDK